MPQHGRLSLTGRPGEVLVQWTTDDMKYGSVKWGATSGKYTEEEHARHLSYSREDMCGGDAKHVRSPPLCLPPATDMCECSSNTVRCCRKAGYRPGNSTMRYSLA